MESTGLLLRTSRGQSRAFLHKAAAWFGVGEKHGSLLMTALHVQATSKVEELEQRLQEASRKLAAAQAALDATDADLQQATSRLQVSDFLLSTGNRDKPIIAVESRRASSPVLPTLCMCRLELGSHRMTDCKVASSPST